MRKLVVSEFLSLDGVFEAPGPDGSGYKYEGWTFPYFCDEFMPFKMSELQAAEIQLLGRVTYDGFAAAWPERTGDEFSDKFNAMPKYVVSKSLKTADWNNSHIISSNVAEEIKKLKEDPKGKGDILIAGSGELVRFLLKEKLVDQLNILLYPIILGTGKKLFEGAEKTELKLTDSEAWSSGVTKLIYEPETK